MAGQSSFGGGEVLGMVWWHVSLAEPVFIEPDPMDGFWPEK